MFEPIYLLCDINVISILTWNLFLLKEMVQVVSCICLLEMCRLSLHLYKIEWCIC